MRRGLARLGVAAGVLVGGLVLSPAATADDGGKPQRDEVTQISDPAITESSGLALISGTLVTVNDSGGRPVVYSVDPSTGRTFRTTRFAVRQVDVEALAPADDVSVWVGDIGNNDGSRRFVTATLVALDGSGSPQTAQSYRLTYPDGVRTDAETLLCDPATGRLYIVSKRPTGGTVYAAPERLDPDRPNRLEAIGDVAPLITDGAFLPDGRHVVLRQYGRAIVYTFPQLEDVGAFALPQQRQGEGLAVVDESTLWLSSEGPNQAVLRVSLPDQVLDAIVETTPSETPSATATPSSSLSPSTDPGSPTDGGDAAGGAASEGGPTMVVLILGGVVIAGAVGLVLLLRHRRPWH